MPTAIAYKIKTTLPLKVESFDKRYVEQRLAEIQAQDPKARILGIPVNR